MKEYQYQGTITVFLSLVSVLFLSLIGTLLESARLQGARAWAAAVTDLGLFSVFGEYEKEILDRYGVLFLDGTGETGDFSVECLAERMSEFMEYNAQPSKGLLGVQGMNLFPMERKECEISGYTLATDEQGAAFYQQVVQAAWENPDIELLELWESNRREAQEQQKAAERYERQDGSAWDALETLEKEKAKEDTEEEHAEEKEEGDAAAKQPGKADPDMENPLTEIRKVKKMGILGLVMKRPADLSDRRIRTAELPSKRKKREGTLPVGKTHTGSIADGIFQNYLMETFGNFGRQTEQGALAYQVEYLLAGKDEDVENLKATVHRLLLLREGVNLAYAASDPKMKAQVKTLAVSIAGEVPVPGLVPALEAVLLLAWAYGESLLDVRTLLAGGKVPFRKDAGTWKLALTKLSQIRELLAACDAGGGDGQDYEDYLRILLLAGDQSAYPLRALDLMESEVGTPADAWIVKARAKVSWYFPSVFLRIPQAFLGMPGEETGYEAQGCMSYE